MNISNENIGIIIIVGVLILSLGLFSYGMMFPSFGMFGYGMMSYFNPIGFIINSIFSILLIIALILFIIWLVKQLQGGNK